MNILQIPWLLLTAFIFSIVCYLIYLFFKDRDKQKLMYSLGLLFSSISFIILSTGFLLDPEDNLFFYNLFMFSGSSYIILLFHTTFQQLFLRKKDFTIIFYSFIFFNIVSSSLILSNLISMDVFGLFMAAGTIIVLLTCLGLIYIDRDIYNLLFLLSIFTSFSASMALNNIDLRQFSYQYLFVVYAYFISFIFLSLIFTIPQSSDITESKGIRSYFSIKNKLKQVKEELYESQEKYRLITENTSDIIAMTTFSYNPKYTYVSPSTEKIMGYSQEELIGKNAFDYVHPDDRKYLRKTLAKYDVFIKSKLGLSNDSNIHEIVEYRVRDKAGNWHYLESTADVAGGQICLVSRDITERKKNDAELQKLASVVRYSKELVNLSNLEGEMMFLNEAGAQILGIDQTHLKDHNIIDVIPEEYQGMVKEELLPSLFKQGFWSGELQYKNLKTGKTTEVHATTFMIKDMETDEPLFLANVSLDITNLKNIQKKLELLNKTLEGKVKSRTKEIQLLLKQKDDLINQLGHDLKNPLGPLINLLPILEKHSSSEKDKEIVTVLLRNAKYMKNLVQKTLEIARLNSPTIKLKHETFSLVEQVETVIKNNTYLLHDKNIDVELSIPMDLVINADRFLFEELLTNLLTNSVKYSPVGGSIYITGNDNEKEFIVSIKDEGIGLDSSQINHVFEDFYKADSSRHDFESSGLGLSICKRIVELHNGRIWVESDGQGKGSLFNIALPKDIKMVDINGMYDRIDSLIIDKKTIS